MAIHGEREKLMKEIYNLLDIKKKSYKINGVIVLATDYSFLYKLNYHELKFLEIKLTKFANQKVDVEVEYGS